MVNSGNNRKKPVTDQFLSVQGLCKSYNTSGARIDILKQANLELNAGETLAIVGASGIGKSTLLHLLGALDRPDSGTYLFQGEDIFLFDNVRLAQFRNKSLGFVFQFHYLLPEFSAFENTMMPALIKGLSKQKAREAAEAILVRVGLKDRLHFRVGKLSGGEQQRVALARALVLNPVILLADEPSGNLDKGSSELVHNLLLELNKEFCMTLIVVTHNMELASYMSHRMTIVDGQLVTY
ncbi:MAG: ABC transporter ATP-binding protein [Deltaproteobacteria bacterium]|nr:ABC transporter ATP-binding protein [Deltaproteobacteria bacterium]MBW2597826.1 ABC transporter ATP-binding protein [Deltaproteobacteria bacterium]MBW2638993.1 ABC transporter ATP-binding protein [Deltaproteobacteria bacterium]MBW2680355.1 ABC transporter ATP-binding protein [Deltaproteobacteria bacterium]